MVLVCVGTVRYLVERVRDLGPCWMLLQKMNNMLELICGMNDMIVFYFVCTLI